MIGKSFSRFLALAGYLLFGCFLIWSTKADDQFHLWVLDVGQGDAILIQTPDNQQVLIDGGPTDQVTAYLGQLMPLWDRTIELVIVSHNHADHLGGLLAVADQYQIGAVWESGAVYTTPEYAAWEAILKQKAIPVTLVRNGYQEERGGIRLEVVYPFGDPQGRTLRYPHDATVLVRVTYQNQTILLTGDIETRHENELVSRLCPSSSENCPALAATILKVPHHGSRTGLEPDFLQAVSPEVAVISVGEKNSYGHPAQTILDRLAESEIMTFRTDLDGTVQFDWDGQQFRATLPGTSLFLSRLVDRFRAFVG